MLVLSYLCLISPLYTDGTGGGINIADQCTFSGYDMSKSGDQTVTVTYSEGEITVYVYYDIHIASNLTYAGSFRASDEDMHVWINLCADGTGTYTFQRSSGTYMQYFTYIIDGSSITFTLTQTYVQTDFTSFSLFKENSVGATRECVYDGENDKMTITISNTNAGGTGARQVEMTRE